MYFQTGQVIFVPKWPKGSLLVFWPHSVFGQNHLYVRMLQTGIPLFRVKSEEFQSSLSAVRTMYHPVRTPICLLLHPSGRCVIPSGLQTLQHHPSGRRASSVRTLHYIEKLLYQLAPSDFHSRTRYIRDLVVSSKRGTLEGVR